MGKDLRFDSCFIYSLSDPRDLKIRYIGKTTNIKVRFNAHIKGKDGKLSKRGIWISELNQLCLMPILKIIEECSYEVGTDRETFHIRTAFANGANLLNTNFQLPNLKLSTSFLAILPNRSLYILDAYAKSLNVDRERVASKIIKDFLDTIDLSSLDFEAENFAEFLNNH